MRPGAAGARADWRREPAQLRDAAALRAESCTQPRVQRASIAHAAAVQAALARAQLGPA
jgi:hypothetical protein